jgi:hypothetical protein
LLCTGAARVALAVGRLVTLALLATLADIGSLAGIDDDHGSCKAQPPSASATNDTSSKRHSSKRYGRMRGFPEKRRDRPLS